MTAAPSPGSKRPTGIVVIAVFAFIFGMLSCTCSAYGVYGTVTGAEQLRAQQAQMEQMSQMNGGFGGIDPSFYDSMIEIQERWFVPNLINQAIALLLSFLVLAVGVLALTGNRTTLKLLTPVFGFGIVYSLVDAGYQIFVQFQTMDAVEEMMNSMVAQQGGGATGMEGVMAGAMGAGLGIAICIAGGMALLKIVYYGWSIAYFRKPEVVAFFDPPPQPAAF